jgi:hypothetical protein
MHLSLSDELHSFNRDDKEKRQILSYFEESELLNIEIETILRQQLISSRRLLMWQTKAITTCCWLV